MSGELHPPLARPKDGHVWEVLGVYRVSDPTPGKQDWRSLDDQEAADRKWLDRELGPGAYRLTVVAGSGSGEFLGRAEYQQVLGLVETGRFDLVRCEDLGRVVRRVHAHLFCELCDDHDTRLIAPNDRLDTALPGWRESSIFAVFHHDRSNRDTSERIKRTHRNRFAAGGLVGNLTYGWTKPTGAKRDDQVSVDPAAAEVYREWFRLLGEEQASFAEVARWLTSVGVKFPTRRPGIHDDPDAKSVARLTFNVLLKGVRERNRRKTRRVNKSGRYVSVKADPHELLVRRVPHLAIFDEAYYDRVVTKVRERTGGGQDRHRRRRVAGLRRRSRRGPRDGRGRRERVRLLLRRVRRRRRGVQAALRAPTVQGPVRRVPRPVALGLSRLRRLVARPGRATVRRP